jgi:branched-chain amino acid transport system ATP-binding protein
MSPLLDVRAVSASYGQIPVLHGISIAVDENESIGLLGPNGHGKTTLLRVISGLHRAAGGEIRWDGTVITNRPVHHMVGCGLIHVAQASRLFPDCTIEENLKLGAYTRRARARERHGLEAVYALFPRLLERRRQPCGTLSGGERQMVAIGVGLMACPRLLMLDEPTLGLAPMVKLELLTAIQEIRDRNVSLVVVDGDAEFMLDLTDRWYAIESGRVTFEASSADRMDSLEIVSMYFGTTGGRGVG